MPEGDTVHLAADRLNRALGGRVLTRTDFRVPRYAAVDLGGRTLEEVVARGKHLLFRIDDLVLHTHFKMDGTWHLYRPGERWREPAFEARVVLETPDRHAVGFRLPVVDLIDRDRENAVVGHLGPDILGPDWDPREATDRLRRDPERPIGDALLDQRAIAGLGNIYRNEICFLSGVHPSMPVGRVPDLDGLVALAKKILEANRSKARQITTGDERRGRTQWVYGRGGRPCRRCGASIRRAHDATERVTYWCPECQLSLGESANSDAMRRRAQVIPPLGHGGPEEPAQE